MPKAARRVVVPNKQGLHARPIAQILEAARPFRARLVVALPDGQAADGRSVLELMTLGAPQGTELCLEAEGEDAEALVEAVACLISRGFGEEC